MPRTLPPATIRTQLPVPLRFADGYATTARVFTFAGRRPGASRLRTRGPCWRMATGRTPRPAAARPAAQRVPHGDVFGSQRCDCGAQIREAVERIADTGGFLLYLRQEGVASACTPNSTPTRCRTGAWTPTRPIARSATRGRARLHRRGADGPRAGLDAGGLVEQQPGQGRAAPPARGDGDRTGAHGVHVCTANARYLATKARRGAHTLDVPPADQARRLSGERARLRRTSGD